MLVFVSYNNAKTLVVDLCIKFIYKKVKVYILLILMYNKNMIKVTKKEFEELINKTEGFNESVHGSNKTQKASSRPYGTYIRSADKELFNISYLRYVQTGIYKLSLFD